jgi:hypothetical protein
MNMTVCNLALRMTCHRRPGCMSRRAYDWAELTVSIEMEHNCTSLVVHLLAAGVCRRLSVSRQH